MTNSRSQPTKQNKTSTPTSHEGAASAPPSQLTQSAIELMDSARMQWQFGDWESLTAIDEKQLADHPDRAKLALLIATAHQQLNDNTRARRYVEHARLWGCDKTLIARLLIGGVHNTLGRASVIARDNERALGHFQESVKGVSGDGRLACQARTIREMGRLQYFGQAADYLESRGIQLRNRQSGDMRDPIRFPLPESTRSELFLLRQDIQRIKESPSPQVTLGDSNHPVHSDHPGATETPRCAIVIAGMRHSGSTALFNAVKLALEASNLTFKSFYSEGSGKEAFQSQSSELILVKTHELRDDVIARAKTIITTRRDLRDTVASAKRRDFPILRQLGSPLEYAKYNRSLHDVWAPYGNYEFIYENFMDDPVSELCRVFNTLGLEHVNAESINHQLQSLPLDKYEETLLSPSHITDPKRKHSYQSTLDSDVVEKLNREHAIWLERYSYFN